MTWRHRRGWPGRRSKIAYARRFEVDCVVETALAEAVVLAARAGRWETVVQIARELAERRAARDGDRGPECTKARRTS